MNRFCCLIAIALCACAGAELRYAPSAPAAPDAARFAPVGSVSFKDSSGGLQQDGTALVLKRPYLDNFRDATLAEFAALKISTGVAGGATLTFELTEATLKRGKGFNADLTSTAAYKILIAPAGGASCEKKASGWAVVHEKFASSPLREAATLALTKAVRELGPTLASSCLAQDGRSAAPAAPTAARDSSLVSVVIGVGARRGHPAGGDGAAADAAAFAAALKNNLGAEEKRLALLVDDAAALSDLNKTLERWLPDHVSPGDRVVVYFAGLGAHDKDGTAYLIPFDGDAEYLESTAFPLWKLLKNLGRLPANSTLILDASFAGSEGRTLLRPGARPLAAVPDQLPPTNVTVLFAASPGQAARVTAGRGDFTAALIRALSTRGGDLRSAFDEAVRGLTAQTPLRLGGR